MGLTVRDRVGSSALVAGTAVGELVGVGDGCAVGTTIGPADGLNVGARSA